MCKGFSSQSRLRCGMIDSGASPLRTRHLSRTRQREEGHRRTVFLSALPPMGTNASSSLARTNRKMSIDIGYVATYEIWVSERTDRVSESTDYNKRRKHSMRAGLARGRLLYRCVFSKESATHRRNLPSRLHSRCHSLGTGMYARRAIASGFPRSNTCENLLLSVSHRGAYSLSSTRVVVHARRLHATRREQQRSKW